MNRFSTRVYGLTCVAMLLASLAAHATTIVLPTDEQLVAKSPLIVTGTVTAATPVDRDGTIWTETTVAVDSTMKGQAEKTITIREIGGMVGDRITKVYGAPELTEGERVLLFLEPSPRGGYRVIDLFVGKFGEGRTMDGRRLWMRNDTEHDATLLDAELRPIPSKNVQRDAVGFESFVADRIAGRVGTKTYGIENPVLDDALRETRRTMKANFTLISEPQVYRWYGFESGQSAAWYAGGTQPGYASGGVGELQTAMSSWVGYGFAKIRYTYNGALAVAAKGLTGPNGVNEVLFNDPLNEISGSWNRNEGGVVGVGGFNGVSSGGSFTATFQADPEHPAGLIRAFAITEGNLTIQNDVSPANGISSTRLAEIIAHEFGHTLGFGHSADASALMYHTVTGLGPSLRDDDQVAARWLYPNGTSGPPAPGAPTPPSGLSTMVSGTSVDLAWTDNATNETSQSIYLSLGSGPFNKVADVAANVESARLSGLGAGSYRAYVVANNSAGSSGPSNASSFAIAGPPVAAFSFTPLTGNAGVTTFTFTDTSTGAITSRLWNFGDGATATAGSATHVYGGPGQYTVTLTVNGPGGSSNTTKKIMVLVPLAAQFSWSPANPTTNHTIQFVDETPGGPTSWNWAFGDGTTSTSQNPSKKYGAQGTYNVTLTVFANGGTSTRSRALTVANTVPGSPVIAAAFDISTSAPAIGSNVTFTDRSTGSPTQWLWTFGDGSTSSAQNPVHAYAAPGTYMVTLNAANASTSSVASKQISVSAIAAYRTLISAAAQTSGAGGTSWRTELSLFNAGLEGATVTMLFLPSGGSGLTRTSYLPPRQSVTYANTLLEVFGLPSGAGAVAIEAVSPGSSAQLRVTSRTFTTGATGTYGQSVPEVQPEKLEATLYITGIASNAAYRTNIGLVNRAASPVSATLTLFSRTGGTIATKSVTLGASSFQQSALWTYFPEVNGASHDALTMRIAASVADAVSAYASVIDNVTQDPIFIQAGGAPSGNALTIPVVGRAAGANGTFWRSDVTLFNPTGDRFTITLRYNGATRALSLGSGDTDVLPDILSSLGQSAGSGLLSVEWDGGTGPVVTSRTYTTAEGGGTYGQSIDPIADLRTEVFVPGLRNDADFRSNVGFVNGGDEAETFQVIVLSPFGNELARNTVTLPAHSQVQYSVSSLFPNVNASAFTLSVQGDPNARLFAYVSMVDNASGDPVFFAGQ